MSDQKKPPSDSENMRVKDTISRSLSPAGGTPAPLMSRDQMVKLQEAFAKIALGNQDLIVALREMTSRTERENERTRRDNAFTRNVVVFAHVVGAVVAISVLVAIVRRSDSVIDAAASIQAASSAQSAEVRKAVSEVRRAVSRDAGP